MGLVVVGGTHYSVSILLLPSCNTVAMCCASAFPSSFLRSASLVTLLFGLASARARISTFSSLHSSAGRLKRG